MHTIHRLCVCVCVCMRTGEMSRMRTFRATKSLALGLSGPNGTANERNSIQSDIGKMLLLAGSRHKDTSSEKRGENCQEEDATFIHCHDIFASYLPFSPNAEARSYSGFFRRWLQRNQNRQKMVGHSPCRFVLPGASRGLQSSLQNVFIAFCLATSLPSPQYGLRHE